MTKFVSLESLEKAEREIEDQMHESNEDQIKRINKMVFFMLLLSTSKYDMHIVHLQDRVIISQTV